MATVPNLLNAPFFTPEPFTQLKTQNPSSSPFFFPSSFPSFPILRRHRFNKHTPIAASLKENVGRFKQTLSNISSLNYWVVRDYYRLVHSVNALEPGIQRLSDGQLTAKTSEFKKRLNQGEAVSDIQAEAFAVVREAAKRKLGMRHFDVQIIGGAVLHDGSIAEMKTGEGKHWFLH